MVLLLLFVFDAVVAYVVGCWLVLRLFVSGCFCLYVFMLQVVCVCLLSFGGLCVCYIFVHWNPVVMHGMP